MNFKGLSNKTDKKLDTFNWLCDIPENQEATDFVEVIFKNTRRRKASFRILLSHWTRVRIH